MKSQSQQVLAGSLKESFASANFSFHGTENLVNFKAFLEAAAAYKSLRNIPDEEAIKGLPLILKGDAAVWWNGIKSKISSWKEFEIQLRRAFAPKPPGYLVFQDILSIKQGENESTETFVANKKALFVLLEPPGVIESAQLDMIYSVLNPKIRERVPRESVATLDDFLKTARDVEQSLNEKPNKNKRSNRSRCNFCRHFGHTAQLCRKKALVNGDHAMDVSDENTEVAIPQPKFHCALDICLRPVVKITIDNFSCAAFIDSGAGISVASFKLYQYLKGIGLKFQERQDTVTLADGVRRKQTVLSVEAPVKICDRTVCTKFNYLPESNVKHPLLGVDFLMDAGMVLNLAQMIWNFHDQPDVTYDLEDEGSLEML